MIKLANPSIQDKDILRTIVDILKSGRFINGPYNQQFSKMWAKQCKSPHCIPVSSGSAALISCLKSIKKHTRHNNYVIIPTLSFAATVFSVIEADCIPVYCSVNQHGLLDQENCKRIIDAQNILAVIPVHLYGQQLILDRKILDSVWVIEDACQAHGIEYVQGNAACFSFYPSKNLGTCGNGGAVVTNEEKIIEYVSAYVNYGDRPGEKYKHRIQGNNLRMGEVEAAVLCAKIDFLAAEVCIRRKQAQEYDSFNIKSFLHPGTNVYHLFPVLCDKADKLVDIFKEEGIETGRHYPYSLPSVVPGDTYYLTGFKDYSYYSELVVTLPIGSHLKDGDIKRISQVLNGKARFSNNVWILR